MPTVQDVLNRKGEEVVSISPRATVVEAARRMNDKRIGALVVVDETKGVGHGARGAVLGIFTERDVLTRVVAAQRDPAATRVEQVMTTPVITCTPRTTLDEVRHAMRAKRIRHIPVSDGTNLVGMVSIGDLNTAEVQVMVQTIQYLEQYMYHG